MTELKLRMSQVEFNGWLAYRRIWGPMNFVRRYDRPAALVSYMLSAVNGGKPELGHFMPWPAQEEFADAESFFLEI